MRLALLVSVAATLALAGCSDPKDPVSPGPKPVLPGPTPVSSASDAAKACPPVFTQPACPGVTRPAATRQGVTGVASARTHRARAVATGGRRYARTTSTVGLPARPIPYRDLDAAYDQGLAGGAGYSQRDKGGYERWRGESRSEARDYAQSGEIRSHGFREESYSDSYSEEDWESGEAMESRYGAASYHHRRGRAAGRDERGLLTWPGKR